MLRNLGMVERMVRIVAGLMILGLYGALDAPWKYLTLIGLLPLGTGLVGHCPAYKALRWKPPA
jgi:hypothetical protein